MKFFKRTTAGVILLIFSGLSCQRHQVLTQTKFHRYEVADIDYENQSSKEVATLIQPYQSEIAAEMNEVIAQIPHTLTKQKIESTLGNWVADAISSFVEEKTGQPVDLSLCNYFGLRVSSLESGPLTKGKIYELMPFDNYVVTQTIDGQTLIKVLEQIAEDEGWPISHQLRMNIAHGKIVAATINGESIKPDQTYRLALSDYIAQSSRSMSMLRDFPIENLEVYYRDALIQVAQKQGTIKANLEGRIKFETP